MYVDLNPIRAAIAQTVELGDTHKPEAIAQSNICFRSFLPSLTLWLSPNVLRSMQADTKGDIYEGLLEKSAKESL